MRTSVCPFRSLLSPRPCARPLPHPTITAPDLRRRLQWTGTGAGAFWISLRRSAPPLKRRKASCGMFCGRIRTGRPCWGTSWAADTTMESSGSRSWAEGSCRIPRGSMPGPSWRNWRGIRQEKRMPISRDKFFFPAIVSGCRSPSAAGRTIWRPGSGRGARPASASTSMTP